MIRTAPILALILALATSARAQSFNIDFDIPAGPGAGVPATFAGGPSGNHGFWNSITSASPVTIPLQGLDGDSSGVTFTRATNGSFAGINNAATSLAYETLLDDYQATVDGPLVYAFNNLTNGFYAVYACGIDPGSQYNLSTISVTGADPDSKPTQYIGGVMPSNRFRAGLTHSVHFKNVTDGHLYITVSDGFLTRGLISGLQIIRLPDPTWRTRLHVDDNATGTNDGSAWISAFSDLQSALATASLGGGSHFDIWVAGGFYRPTPGTDRTATFSIPSGLRIYGGFAGNESTLAQRVNPLAVPSYLTGSIGASGSADDSHTVVTMTDVSSSTLFEGFFIARARNDSSSHGGGMIIESSDAPIIRNCDFTTNEAFNGAALYIYNSSPRIVNTTFYNNSAIDGSGGAIERAGQIGTTIIQNCRFLSNHASRRGGAVYADLGWLDIANSLFSGNSASIDAGAIHAVGAIPTFWLRNCTLYHNTAPGPCGGVLVEGSMDLQLHNCILWNNIGGGPVGTQQLSIPAPDLFASYNTIQGSSPDPLFINPSGPDGIPGTFDDNCRLQPGSPCIDSADSARLPLDLTDLNANGVTNELLPLDLDGLPRQLDVPTAPNSGAGYPPPDRGCYEFQAAAGACYANCDGSLSAPALNVLDFTCFLNKFAAGDPYANCDGSLTPPVLNILDFTCFLNQFAAGCP